MTKSKDIMESLDEEELKMMDQTVQDRILYHFEAFEISNEKAVNDIAFLEKYKNYKPSRPVTRHNPLGKGEHD